MSDVSQIHTPTAVAGKFTLQQFIDKYGKYRGTNEGDAFVKKWAAFHYENYLESGTLPDFMR